MQSKTDRFLTPLNGGAYAESTYVTSSFKTSPPRQIIQDEAKAKDGRPLWLLELNKQTPAGANYDINSSFGSA